MRRPSSGPGGGREQPRRAVPHVPELPLQRPGARGRDGSPPARDEVDRPVEGLDGSPETPEHERATGRPRRARRGARSPSMPSPPAPPAPSGPVGGAPSRVAARPGSTRLVGCRDPVSLLVMERSTCSTSWRPCMRSRGRRRLSAAPGRAARRARGSRGVRRSGPHRPASRGDGIPHRAAGIRDGHRRRRASGRRAERARTLGRHAEHPLDTEASRAGAAGAGRAARTADSHRRLLRVRAAGSLQPGRLAALAGVLASGWSEAPTFWREGEWSSRWRCRAPAVP
jgi:hypothetical protein